MSDTNFIAECPSNACAINEFSIECYLEKLLIAAGEVPSQAHRLTQLLGLTREQDFETEEQWSNFLKLWEQS